MKKRRGGINEERINILQTCTSLDQQNFIKVKELKELSLEKLIEVGQVDWKTYYLQLHIWVWLYGHHLGSWGYL